MDSAASLFHINTKLTDLCSNSVYTKTISLKDVKFITTFRQFSKNYTITGGLLKIKQIM